MRSPTIQGRASSTPNASDRLRRLADARDQKAAAWMPEPGDELVGTFRGWTQGVTKRNETHPIALVEDEGGVLHAVWVFYSVLRSEMQKADPQLGEAILIRRLEDREGPNGPYKVHRVVVDRAEADPFADIAPPIDEGATGDRKLTTPPTHSPGNMNCPDPAGPFARREGDQ